MSTPASTRFPFRKRRSAIKAIVRQAPTPIAGIRYYHPTEDATLEGRDGQFSHKYESMPVPLLDADYAASEGVPPDYDAVGRGIYAALRTNPDCAYGQRYAHILKEGYPHYIAELASQVVMLDHKDVDVTYLDRKINYLKIFALIEPENAQLPKEIGLTLLDKGLRLSALQQTTVTLYRAEKFLRQALSLGADDVGTRNDLGEVCYLLGKYDDSVFLWRDIIPDLPVDQGAKLARRIEGIASGRVPRVPAVDYLEAIAVAFDYHLRQDYEEAAAILHDVLEDELFRKEFPLPVIHFILGSCCSSLGMKGQAEEQYNEALRLDPEYTEARRALEELDPR